MARPWLLVVTALAGWCFGACGGEVPLPQRAQVGADAPLGTGLVVSEPEPLAEQPLRLLSMTPRGRVPDTGVQIQLVFNKPLRSLTVAEDEPLPGFSIHPVIAGTWRWAGTQALHFTPDPNSIHAATEYTVRVPRGTRAVDGSSLEEDAVLRFETPRPQLVSVSSTTEDSPMLVPTSQLEARFSLPVTADALRHSLRAEFHTEHDGSRITRPLAFAISRPNAQFPERLLLRPEEPLPLDARITLEFGDGLVSEAGPLPMAQTERRSFRTHGPLTARLDCPGDGAGCHGRVQLAFSNPIAVAQLPGLLQLSPRIRFTVEPSSRVGPERAAEFSIQADFQVGVEYTLTVQPGVRDVYDQLLARAPSLTFQVAPSQPSISIGASDGLLEPSLGDGVLVGGRNVPQFQQWTLALNPEGFAEYLRNQNEDWLLSQSGVQRREIAPRANTNQGWLRQFPFSELLDSRSGAFAFGIIAESPDGTEAPIKQHVVIHPTDLALTTRLGARGGLLWVTRMSDGSPVAGATVRFLGLEGNGRERFRTGPDGVARIPSETMQDAPRFPRNLLAIAEFADDWSYSRLPELERYQPRTLGYVFTDRGIYRPGEEVSVKAWLRRETPTGSRPWTGQRVHLRLLRSQGAEVASTIAHTNEFGAVSAQFRIPSSAPLERHRVVVEVGSERWAESIRVEEYRPTEFAPEVSFVDGEYTRGEDIEARVTSRYLFGAMMSGASVEVWDEPVAAHFHPKGTEELATDAWEFRESLKDPLQLDPLRGSSRSTATLDQSGAHRTRFATRFAALGPVRLVAHAKVQDKSRQVVSASASVLVLPGEYQLGLSALPESLPERARVAPFVIAVDRRGGRRGGVRVTQRAYHRPYRWLSRQLPDATLVDSCEHITHANRASSCDLQLGRGGDYVILATAHDPRGNPIHAATSVLVTGRPSLSSDYRAEQLSLHLDRADYLAGETAHVTVETPVKNAAVLLVLEHERVLWHEQRRARGHIATFDVKVPTTLATNARLVAHVARGSTPYAPQSPSERYFRPWETGPALLTETAELSIRQTHRRLQVEVTPDSTQVAPGEVVRVRFQVREESGAPHAAELAVLAVDEGVLALTAHATPHPFDAFRPLRHSVVGMRDSREEMGWLFEPDTSPVWGQGFGAGHGRLGGTHTTRAPRVRMGRASALAGAQPARSDFTTTPYFNPSLVTDENGVAEALVPLSELTTSYRIMAVASSKDDYHGAGESNVETRRPLLLRSALPRFARVGDRFEAGVLVSNLSNTAVQGVVDVSAKGAVLRDAARRGFALGPRQTDEVRFAFSTATSGTARFVFRLQSDGYQDSVQVEIPVTLPIAPETVSLYGHTDEVRRERIANLEQLSSDYGGLDVRLSSSALVGLTSSIEDLTTYPYECTEQLTSQLLPLLPLRDLAGDFGMALPDDLPNRIGDTIAKLLQRQHHDGGFGLWPEDPESHPWVTAYVFRTLDEAKRRGTDVPEQAIWEAYEYLRRYTHQDARDDTYRPTLAYIALAFAEHGTPSRALMERMLTGAERDPPFARALLLSALASSRAQFGRHWAQAPDLKPWKKKLSDGIRTLSRSLEAELRIDGNRAFVRSNSTRYRWLFDSQTRTLALMLDALLAADPKHPLAEPMARGLLAERRDGSWRSTQETAAALLALDRYRRLQEPAIPRFDATVWFGGTRLGATRHRGHSTQAAEFVLPMSQLPKQGSMLAFRKQGRGTLFYEVLLRYTKRDLPEASLDHGFSISHRLHPVPTGPLPGAVRDGHAPGALRFHGGDVVLGDVTVLVPTRRDYVVIEAPLPAGLEAIDTSLATNQAENLGGFSAPDREAPWHRRELRDDRVLYFLNQLHPGVHRFHYLARAITVGRFLVPPARVEEMYSPETFGRTGASVVEVR